VIARAGPTWQEAFELVATFPIPGITLPHRLSPMLFGTTPTISLSEQHWRTSGKLLPPLFFPPVIRFLIAVPPARMEASPPQPWPFGLSAWTSSALRRGRCLRIFCSLFSGRFQDFSVVVRWLAGHCPPSGYSCFVLHMWSVMLAFCLFVLEAGDIVAY